MARRISAGTGEAARVARRVAAGTGEWTIARSLLAIGALVTGVALTGWVITAHPLAGGLLALGAFPGLGLLSVAVLVGYTRLLPAALLLLGGSAAVAVLVAELPAEHAAGIGVALVAALELARWSIERRVDPPAEDASAGPRLRHLAAVLIGGWLVGALAVPATTGGLALARWGPVIAALAVVVVIAAVAAIARADGSRADT
jgi:hypothetical protein